MPRRQGQRVHEAAFPPRHEGGLASAWEPDGWEVGAFQTEAKDGREHPHSSETHTGGQKGWTKDRSPLFSAGCLVLTVAAWPGAGIRMQTCPQAGRSSRETS